MLDWIALWILLAVICVGLAGGRMGKGGFLLAYFFGLSLIHVPGAINYLGSAPGLNGFEETLVGFRATIIGLCALIVGYVSCQSGAKPDKQSKSRKRFMALNGERLIIAGAVAYFGVMPIAGFVPSLTSLISPIGSLLVLGFIVFFRQLIEGLKSPYTLFVILGVALLPLSTLISGGFIGFGVYWVLTIGTFAWAQSRKLWLVLLIVPLVAYAGVSLGAAYFGERSAIREAVWYQQADFGDRLDRIADIVRNLEPYDIENADHIVPIDERLNQNFLVGAGILNHQKGNVDLLLGASVPWWTFIPRAVWPEKPLVGGGGDLVSKFTGIPFAVGTSVGAGQPLEFYANFGWWGLVVGFGALGWILAHHDRGLARSLLARDTRQVLCFGLPGLALLQPGGNLLEIGVAFVAAVIVARLIAWVLPLVFSSRRRLTKGNA